MRHLIRLTAVSLTRWSPASHVTEFHRSTAMQDILMLAIGLGFFVLSVGYCYACDRL
jgi:hypothetical protein